MPEEKWKCPKCGTENAMDDNFCGECGTKKPEIRVPNSEIGMAGKVVSDKADPDPIPAQTANYLRQATEESKASKRSSWDDLEDTDDVVTDDKFSGKYLILSIVWPLAGLILGIYYLIKGKSKSGSVYLIVGAIGMVLVFVLGML